MSAWYYLYESLWYYLNENARYYLHESAWYYLHESAWYYLHDSAWYYLLPSWNITTFLLMLQIIAVVFSMQICTICLTEKIVVNCKFFFVLLSLLIHEGK